MAEIKTGIFAKNVQKRLNRAQEKVRRPRREVKPLPARLWLDDAMRGSVVEGGEGLRDVLRAAGLQACGAPS